MSTFLVDFENVNSNSLKGINKLSKRDRIYIFYSKNADKITIDLHKKLISCSAEIEFILVSVGGKNSLDFQLITFLGYLIGQDPSEKYYIVSEDDGFKYAAGFWSVRNISVSLIPEITGKDNAEKDENEILDKVNELFSDNDTRQTVISYISKYNTKNSIYTALVKKYAQNKGLEIYNKVKPLIKDKK